MSGRRTLSQGTILAAWFAVSISTTFAQTEPTDLASFVTSRWGTTPKGATRVVLQLDRRVEYRTERVEEHGGIDVHLSGTGSEELPPTMQIGGPVLTRVTFRATPSGVIARLVGAGPALEPRTFTLESPFRIVIDVTGSGTLPRDPAPKPVTVIDPAPATKSPRPALPAQDDSRSTSIFENEAPAASSARAEGEETEFESLVAWIHVLKTRIDALNSSTTHQDRARHRRSLAFLLAERGILVEAERTLTSALTSEGYLAEHAFPDSIYLAELRLEIGNLEGASAVLRNLDARSASPQRQHRIARTMLACGLPRLAIALVRTAVPELADPERSEAQLLLARCHWAQQEVPEALSYVRTLTSSGSTPPAVLSSALILHADCLWTMERPRDAKGLYQRAAARELTPEEASWTTLQLGNLARREGRLQEAKDHYRTALERWPETFYASQADWFLRVAEEMEKLRQAEVVQDRG